MPPYSTSPCPDAAGIEVKPYGRFLWLLVVTGGLISPPPEFSGGPWYDEADDECLHAGTSRLIRSMKKKELVARSLMDRDMAGLSLGVRNMKPRSCLHEFSFSVTSES